MRARSGASSARAGQGGERVQNRCVGRAQWLARAHKRLGSGRRAPGVDIGHLACVGDRGERGAVGPIRAGRPAEAERPAPAAPEAHSTCAHVCPGGRHLAGRGAAGRGQQLRASVWMPEMWAGESEGRYSARLNRTAISPPAGLDLARSARSLLVAQRGPVPGKGERATAPRGQLSEVKA